MNWSTIGIAAALIALAYAVDGRAQVYPWLGVEPPCYSGPPHSAPQCGKVPADAKPVEGAPYTNYGDAENPVQCVEQQLTWEDPPGCRQYCKLWVHCGQAT